MKKKPSQLRRKNKAKTKRLDREKKMNELRKGLKRNRADTNIVLMRNEADEELVLAVRRGLLGHSSSPVLRISADEVVGAVEDIKELGGIATKVGVMVLAQLTGHHLSMGADGLAKALAKFAQIDLEAIKKEAEESDANDGGAHGGGPSELPASPADNGGGGSDDASDKGQTEGTTQTEGAI